MINDLVTAYLGIVGNPIIRVLLCGLVLLFAIHVGRVKGIPKVHTPNDRSYYIYQMVSTVLYATLLLLVFVLFPVPVFTWLFTLFASVPRM